jgi:hypothetical protein
MSAALFYARRNPVLCLGQIITALRIACRADSAIWLPHWLPLHAMTGDVTTAVSYHIVIYWIFWSGWRESNPHQ